MPNEAVYICVYRQVVPAIQRRIREVEDAAKHYKDISELVKRIRTGKSVYDWGDDPSFFSAEYHQGDAAFAGWGVCRPNVRKQLHRGSVVVFFCARRVNKGEATQYFFVGYGTVKHRIDDRRMS